MPELIRNDLGAVACMLSIDMLSFFSWWSYLFVGAAYSALVFTGEMSKDGPLIFSKQNSNSLGRILLLHGLFLLIILSFMRAGPLIDRVTPTWMTTPVGKAGSILEIVFIAGLVLLSFIERRWLYLESNRT